VLSFGDKDLVVAAYPPFAQSILNRWAQSPNCLTGRNKTHAARHYISSKASNKSGVFYVRARKAETHRGGRRQAITEKRRRPIASRYVTSTPGCRLGVSPYR